jgi:hypothetical protein
MSKAPPQIRVRDLSWPLRTMIIVCAVTAAIMLIYFIIAIFYILASSNMF